MNKFKDRILLLIGFIAVISGCGKDPVFDFFVGGQPNFIGDHKFVPGLNIFGVIRPDSLQSEPMSFVHVEKVIAAIGDISDSFPVNIAHVMIYKIENNVVIDSVNFKYGNPDSLFSLSEYRPDKFRPAAGEHYKVICTANDLPVLTAETTVPAVPQLENDTIAIMGNKIKFSILNDSSSAMYDIYYYVNGNEYFKRLVRENAGNTDVEIETSESVHHGSKLKIYAYDIKLSGYFAAANLSFKPNTYRPPFSNVNNGYGCFGSMNILEKNLK